MSMQTEMTQGRCHPCNMAFIWKKSQGRLLKNTRCPHCGGRLSQTIHYLRSVKWYSLDGEPETGTEAVMRNRPAEAEKEIRA